jgi:hypothetical protein
MQGQCQKIVVLRTDDLTLESRSSISARVWLFNWRKAAFQKKGSRSLADARAATPSTIRSEGKALLPGECSQPSPQSLS